MEDSTPPLPSETILTTETREWIFSSDEERIYNPTDIAMERNLLYWASQVKNLMQKMESLKAENKQLHSEVNNLKQLVSKMKKQENINLQKPNGESPRLQTEIS